MSVAVEASYNGMMHWLRGNDSILTAAILGACRHGSYKLVNFHWRRRADCSKEVPAGEALRACTSFDYFICNIPVVICKLDLVFNFNQIVNRQLKNNNKKLALAGT